MPRVSSVSNAEITMPPPAGMPQEVISPSVSAPLTLEDITRLALSPSPEDRQRARESLEILNMLGEAQRNAKTKAEEDAKLATNVKISYMNAKAIEQKEAEDLQRQASCAAAQHQHERGGEVAIIGQKTFSGEMRYACLKCQGTFIGIGDKLGQLPYPVAAKMKAEQIGGVGLI